MLSDVIMALHLVAMDTNGFVFSWHSAIMSIVKTQFMIMDYDNTEKIKNNRTSI